MASVAEKGARTGPRRTARALPVLFVSHGSPMTAVETSVYTRGLYGFFAGVPRPRAVVVVSAHFLASSPVRVTASARPETLHDFGGFPPELYRLAYPCPGDPALAAMIVGLLDGAGIPAALDERRGLDHGTWVPLSKLAPEADVPVVAVSLPYGAPPRELMALGAALAPLRDEGVLLVGSGGLVHNLRAVRFGADDAPVDRWARAFEDFMIEKLRVRDVAALVDYAARAPHVGLAHPTTDHLDPVFVVLGASRAGDVYADVTTGIRMGNLSMRSFRFG